MLIEIYIMSNSEQMSLMIEKFTLSVKSYEINKNSLITPHTHKLILLC